MSPASTALQADSLPLSHRGRSRMALRVKKSANGQRTAAFSWFSWWRLRDEIQLIDKLFFKCSYCTLALIYWSFSATS